jgi:sugar phosphate isomerase/epimerase
MTRREFFARTAVLATLPRLAAASRATAADLPHDIRAGAADALFVSLNGALTRGVSGADKVRLAARVGYGGVDWDLGPAKTAGLEATRALFAETRIVPTIVNLPLPRPLPFSGEDAAFADALKALAEDAAFTAAVGCRKMMVVLPASTQLSRADQRRLAVERLTAIATVLKASDIRLGLEFLGPLYFRTGRADGPKTEPFIWNMPDAVQLAADTGDNVGVILDAWHWHHSGSTTKDITDAGAPRIVHVHISDAKVMPAEDVRDNMRLMPGEGVIDLVGFLQALRRAGYTGGISPEPLGRVPNDMTPEAAAALALETTRAVMRKAGVA